MAAVDLRYARALDTVVTEQQLSRSEVKGQLLDFAASYEGSPQLHEVLNDPSIPQEQKVRVIDAISRRTGMHGTVRNFVAVVTSHERLSELREIIEAYLQLADKETGVAEAEVVSARPLDEAGRRSLEASIARLTGDSQVRASYREGSTVYDGSVRGQLEQMRQRLGAAAK